MSKLFRIVIVSMALLGMAASVVACDGSTPADAGDDAGATE
jgi:hypothetical protein